MKKYLYLFAFALLLYLISIIPVSAKEIRTCVRSDSDLHVRERFNLGTNRNDILTTPCVDEIQKVYDFADLLTDEEEDKLYQEAINYIETTNYDLAIVTTNENSKISSDHYANDFYVYNDFGKKDTLDGVVILIDMSDRTYVFITKGYAIKMYDDTRHNAIYDDTDPYMSRQQYYNAISNIITKLKNYYSMGYPSSTENLIIDENGEPSYIKYMPYGLIGFISGIITLIVSIILYNKSKLKIKVGSTISYLKEQKITKKEDQLVNTIVTHTLRYNDSSSGGGHSSGGGSTFHSSSSGSSFGSTGGRHF